MKIELRDINTIVPYDKNVKKHDESQVKKIAKSIQEFQWDQPIVVDKNGVIIKGHGRRLAAISLGLKRVPVIVRDDLTEEQIRASRLSDNHTALSGIDTELLRMELSDMNLELLAGIYEEKELNFSTNDLGESNLDAFIGDIDGAVSELDKKTHEKTAELSERRVPLSKALGFKDVPGSAELILNRFMAFAEETTKLKGDQAFLGFLKMHTPA